MEDGVQSLDRSRFKLGDIWQPGSDVPRRKKKKERFLKLLAIDEKTK